MAQNTVDEIPKVNLDKNQSAEVDTNDINQYDNLEEV